MSKTPSNNTVVIAAAGSRKTTYLVEEALKLSGKKILIVTYTIYNLNQIRQYFMDRVGLVPGNVVVQSWYSFLLEDCVRPYQNVMYEKKRIETICFVEGKSCPYTRKSDTDRYFFTPDGDRIYSDKISDFACICNDKSDGLVTRRLEGIYEHIFIDEVQDLAGYDFDFLEQLFLSGISVTAVGDNRQATYFTNCSPKNDKFKGEDVIVLFKDWEKRGICTIEEKNDCYRCNQRICDVADLLYPDMQRTESKNDERTGHDGVFIVSLKDLKPYVNKYNPAVLKDTKKTKTEGLSSLNFGVSKGQTFDRVLVFPNGPIRNFLKTGDGSSLNPKTRALLYVGITRARHSVAFVYDDVCWLQEWDSEDDR